MSPERIRSGGASPEDDVYALGLTLLEMWTCRVPEPGYKPRAKTMRQQIMFDVPAGLSIDEIKQVFRCLSADAAAAPARRATCASSIPSRSRPTPSRSRASASIRARRRVGTQRRRSRPERRRCSPRSPRTRPSSSGELVSLEKPIVTIGRRAENDICVPEATVSGQHAQLKWQNATWIVEDIGSTNGTYVDHNYERRKNVNLMHGGEVQFGELRFKLVSFAKDSAEPQARPRLPREARRADRPADARRAAARARRGGWVRRLGRGAADHRALRAARARTAS